MRKVGTMAQVRRCGRRRVDLPEGVPIEEREKQQGAEGEPVFVETKEQAPREFYISEMGAEKHGYTRACGGCSS